MARISHRALSDPVFAKIANATTTSLHQRLDDAAERARAAEIRLDALEHGQREQLAYLSQRLAELEARFGSERALLRGALAGVMDAIGPVTGRLDAAETRAEFIRDELFAEVQRLAVTPRLLSSESRQAATGLSEEGPAWTPPPGPVRLNLGCGPIAVEGYVNVDSRPLPTVDLVADVCSLPVKDGSVEEVRAAHLLEHFTDTEIREVVLPEWSRVLERGGQLTIIAPDSDAMARAYAAGAMPFEDLKLVTFGGREYEGNAHFTMFSPESIVPLLEMAGFTGVDVAAAARPNGACLEFEVHAYASADGTPVQ
jgi:hypothetical protein